MYSASVHRRSICLNGARTFERACVVAVRALVGALATVDAHVTRQVGLHLEGGLAEVADVGRVARVLAQVHRQVLLRARPVVAQLTAETRRRRL